MLFLMSPSPMYHQSRLLLLEMLVTRVSLLQTNNKNYLRRLFVEFGGLVGRLRPRVLWIIADELYLEDLMFLAKSRLCRWRLYPTLMEVRRPTRRDDF